MKAISVPGHAGRTSFGVAAPSVLASNGFASRVIIECSKMILEEIWLSRKRSAQAIFPTELCT